MEKFQAFSTLFEGFSQYQARTGAISSINREKNSVTQSGFFSEQQYRKAASAIVGTSRAARAVSGIAMTGSALLVDRATVNEAVLNEANLLKQRYRQERSLQQERASQKRARTLGLITTAVTLGAGGFGA